MKIGSKTLQFFLVEGAASGVRHGAETTYREAYSTLARGSFITSSQRVETQYWIKDQNGNDRQVTFGATVPMRDGHQIKAVYVGWEGEDAIWPIAIYNESTRTLVRRGAMDTIRLLSMKVMAPFGCLGAVVGGIALVVFPIVGYQTFNTERAGFNGFLAAVGWLVFWALRNNAWGKNFVGRLEDSLRSETANTLGFRDGIPKDVAVSVV